MDENLTNFVNLLNRQRQRPPVPEELSGLPNWAQRELTKRPEAPPPKQAEPANGAKHGAEPKSEIVVEAKRTDVAPAAQPSVVVAPQAPKPTVVASPPPTPPVVEIVPPVSAAKAEILPPAAKVPTQVAALTDVDPKRDPEAWLARFLAEEAGPRKPAAKLETTPRATTSVATEAKVDGNVAVKHAATEKSVREPAEKKIETPPSADKTAEIAPTFAKEGATPVADPIETTPAIAQAGEIVPLQPIIAEALASPRAGRRPIAYALAAAAVIAAVALVVGAYWYTHSEPELTADTKSAAPAAADKPPQTLAKEAPTPAVAQPKTAAAKPEPPKTITAAKPVAPSPTQAAADKPKPETKVAVAPTSKTAPAPTQAVKPIDKPKPETTIAAAPTPSPVLKPTPPANPPGAPAVVTAQRTPEKPPSPQAAKPASAPAPIVAAAPTSPTPTQVAMLPGATTPAINPAPPAASAAIGTGEPTWRRNAIPAPAFSGQPQIAIVIDDLGLDRDRTARAVALDGPVTLSFLAYASDLPKQTAAARNAGHELIVHVPMEPIVQPKYVAQTAGANPAHAELLRRLRWDLSRFTGYVGVNNHMGNSLSSDSESTQTVIAELKTRGLLFLDSHVAGAGLLKAAAREGVPAVTCDVLLDDDVTASSVTDRLAELERIARQHGTAIAIGHPHDLTLDALKVWIASLPAKGLQLVPLTAVVRDREQHVAAGGAG